MTLKVLALAAQAVLAFAVSSTARSQSEVNYIDFSQLAGESIHEKITQLYAAGAIPTIDNMTGVSIGRCFKPQEPNSPVAVATYVTGAFVLAPEGPITGSIIAADLRFNSNIRYDALDNITTITQLRSLATVPETKDLLPTRLENNALCTTNKNIRNCYRVNGQYIVVQHLETGGTTAMCYYFKKITAP